MPRTRSVEETVTEVIDADVRGAANLPTRMPLEGRFRWSCVCLIDTEGGLGLC